MISGTAFSHKPGMLFKCFDSMFGASKMLNNIKDKCSVAGSVRASIIDINENPFD